MNLTKKVLLLRAGDRQDGETKSTSLADSKLSNMGRFQMTETYQKISHYVTITDILDFYCPHSKPAVESAEILRRLFSSSGVKTRDLKKDGHLFSDPNHDYDPEWLKTELIHSTATAIIVVAHLELVRWFPKDLGKDRNYAKAGEGIFMHNGKIELIELNDG